jgi:hypothetical protein
MLRLVIVMLTTALIGCASSGPSRSLAPGDLAVLAGTWNGTVTPPSGGGGVMPAEGTLTLSPSGDYVFQVGAIVSRGKAVIKDGALMLTSTSISGGLATAQRTSTATLSERPDGMLLLSGFGHSDSGPFNFEVTRKK